MRSDRPGLPFATALAVVGPEAQAASGRVLESGRTRPFELIDFSAVLEDEHDHAPVDLVLCVANVGFKTYVMIPFRSMTNQCG